MSFTLNDFDDINKIQAIKQFADQLDHFVMVVDCENRCIIVNEALARASGFNSAEKIMSKRLTSADFNGPVAELAEVLHSENKQVIDSTQSRTCITNAHLSDQKLHLIFGTKKPIIDLNGNVMGVTMLFSKITANPLINLAYVLSQSTKYYKNKKQFEQFSFLVTEEVKELNITPKQMECLFYLLRGKSHIEIAAPS